MGFFINVSTFPSTNWRKIVLEDRAGYDGVKMSLNLVVARSIFIVEKRILMSYQGQRAFSEPRLISSLSAVRPTWSRAPIVPVLFSSVLSHFHLVVVYDILEASTPSVFQLNGSFCFLTIRRSPPRSGPALEQSVDFLQNQPSL